VIQGAVKAQGIQAAEIEGAFAHAVVLRADAIFVTPNPFFNAHKERLVALAARHRLPALYEFREFVEAGGLMCYGRRSRAMPTRTE